MVNSNPWGTVVGPETNEETERVLGLKIDPFIVVQKGEPCRVQGCSDPITLKVRGLCEKHKRSFFTKRRTTNPDRPKCDVPWCDKKEYSKGKCRYHNQRANAGLEITPPTLKAKTGDPCLVEGCSIPSIGRGYCNSHYLQYRNGETFRPVRPHNKPPVVDNKKECTRCHEWKDLSDYYTRKNSAGVMKPVSRCKKCWIELVALNDKK